MVKLAQLVELQKFTDEADFTIIKRWFIENNLESEGIALMSELSKSKIYKLENQLDYARSWADSIPTEHFYQMYDTHTATMITRILISYIVNGAVSDGLCEWAAEHFPQMDVPSVIFAPALEWLAKNKGIRFRNYKDREEI